MITNAFLPRAGLPWLTQIKALWQRLDHPFRMVSIGAAAMICASTYAGVVVTSYIEDLFGHKAAASTALYMDSFIEPLVQELATKPALSAKNRQALESLFSPTSIGKPVISFRIWVGDRIVFSSHNDIIGKTFRSTNARDKAYQGDVVARFGLDGDDDEEERALGAPILEIYAPIRQTGTNRIIALAEASELAVELRSKIRVAQYTSYAVIAGLAASLLFLFFRLTDGLQSRIGELAKQRTNDQQQRKRVWNASNRAFEMSDRDLQRVGQELQDGPLQLVAYALLRLDALHENPGQLGKEVDDISKALRTCATQIREASAGLVTSKVEKLSLPQVIGVAAALHELRAGARVGCQFQELPLDVPYALKICLYQFLTEILSKAHDLGAPEQLHVSARRDAEMLLVDLRWSIDGHKPLAWFLGELDDASQSLRPRVEALGGAILVRSETRQEISVNASIPIGDMETIND